MLSCRALLPALCLGAALPFAPARAQTPAAAATALRLPRFFADGMVVQRDAKIPVWGWGAPGSTVGVGISLADTTRRTTRMTASFVRVGPDSTWKVVLPALRAGGPYEIDIAANGGGNAGEHVTVRDVLVGDVWVASGQSNMEFTLARGNDAAREIAAAHDSGIREFKVPTSWSWTPEADVVGGGWSPADPQHAANLSAVAYFFARDLRKSVGVPIGIVNTTWGGSAIETWIAPRAQGLGDSAWQAVSAREQAYAAAQRDTMEAHVGAPLPTVDAGLVNGRALWADPALDDASWKTIPVPGGWEQNGYPGLDGVAWLRTTVTLSSAEARGGARLSLGTVDDDDRTWVNGVEVGQTVGYNVPRLYDVPASALHAGANVIAVRVFDGGGGGGIMAAPEQLYLEVGGARRPLAGAWRFRVGVVALGTDAMHINKVPAVVYNRMINPLLPMPVRGFIWYQGESNADRNEQALAYRAQFAAMITSWRKSWGHGDLPFLWVQLPNYGPVDSVPPTVAPWAALRESQTAALALPNTGQAVTIDVGEAGDIHPKDKQDVGHRLALVAEKVAYHKRVDAAGPTYQAMRVANGRATLDFTNLDGGLAARASGDSIPGFAIAGADRRFVWANARLDGDRVIVWSDAVKAPVAVRYAWGNSPRAAGLYGKGGLPAAPFRTDAW